MISIFFLLFYSFPYICKIYFDNYKISVIIPIYNSEKYISVCLNSVISQTLKNIEIICIEDGSKDKSLSILEEYQKHDKRLIHNCISLNFVDTLNYLKNY